MTGTTEDAFLGGRLTIRQPERGFRAGVDSVMLAAAVEAPAGATVLELGAGVGVAALCLARRAAGVRVVGLEIQPGMAALARDNAAGNGLADRVLFLDGAVEAPPGEVAAHGFDRVMMNPPFFVEGPADPSPDPSKRRAHSADAALLERWAGAARKFLRPKGVVTAIIPAGRTPDLLAALTRGFGGVSVFPLWPRAGEPAKRVLVAATKDSRAAFSLRAGMALHEAAGGFTPAAEAILRHGAALDWAAGPRRETAT